MWYTHNGHFLGMHFLWWVLLFIVIVWVLATRRQRSGERQERDEALDILRKRFANGEISKEEYEEKKKLLE